jgi:hypothetical protein
VKLCREGRKEREKEGTYFLEWKQIFMLEKCGSFVAKPECTLGECVKGNVCGGSATARGWLLRLRDAMFLRRLRRPEGFACSARTNICKIFTPTRKSAQDCAMARIGSKDGTLKVSLKVHTHHLASPGHSEGHLSIVFYLSSQYQW